MPDYVNYMTSLTLDAIAGKAEDAVVVDYILKGKSTDTNFKTTSYERLCDVIASKFIRRCLINRSALAVNC